MKMIIPVFIASVILGFTPSAPSPAGGGANILKGWLSDEQCAPSRAANSIFTSTSAYCAKQCVSKGAKIVLILPDEKEILNIDNQDAAKEHVGDYVEVTGKTEAAAKTNSGAKTFHIDTIKMITEGKTMCGIPKKK
jgi:hypothetical protein